ncbi:MAG: hypothetical protein ACXVA9_02055 [Bdellovibrionales bacterium]
MKYFSILIFALSLQASATEVDDTLNYYEPIADSEVLLNAKVQEQIDNARSQYFGCNLNTFGKVAARYLTGNLFYGAIEAQANKSLLIDKRTSKIHDSLYSGTPFEFSIVGRLFQLASTINVAGHHTGTDKLGHFFDMGYELFNLYQNDYTLPDLLGKSTSEQQGIWGLYTTGVKSYGDMTANFDGFRFWKDMLGKTENPYFVCEEGSLKQVRQFLWSDYVTAAWTEAVNCSAYSSPDYQVIIDRNLTLAEQRDGRRYHCPIDPALCAPIRAHYGQWFETSQLDRFISPLCK